MRENQNKILNLVKEKFLTIGGFKIIGENEKAMHLDFNGHSIHLEAQLDKSNTFTTIFITDIQKVLTDNNLLKEIRFTDEDEDDADVKMSSLVINEVGIDMYQIVKDVEDGIVSSRSHAYEPTGFEKEDYNTFTINFQCLGRELSVTLVKGDNMYMLTANVDRIVNTSLKENFIKYTKLTQNLINNLHKP